MTFITSKPNITVESLKEKACCHASVAVFCPSFTHFVPSYLYLSADQMCALSSKSWGQRRNTLALAVIGTKGPSVERKRKCDVLWFVEAITNPVSLTELESSSCSNGQRWKVAVPTGKSAWRFPTVTCTYEFLLKLSSKCSLIVEFTMLPIQMTL